MKACRSISVFVLFVSCFGCGNPPQAATVEPVPNSDAVAVSDVRLPSRNTGSVLWYRVVVPKMGNSERLPVLYLLHGANSGPVELMERSEITKLAEAQRLVVVMPEAGLSYYTNAAHRRNARWEDAITQDLRRDVESRFAVLAGRQHTGIAGISMGGYGAVKLALKHPELYGFAGSLSGALDITQRPASLKRWGQSWRTWMIFGVAPAARKDEDVFALLNRAEPVKPTKWFQSCGQDDPLHGINLKFGRQLREHGAQLESITTPGGHDWQSWKAAMPELFKAAKEGLQ